MEGRLFPCSHVSNCGYINVVAAKLSKRSLRVSRLSDMVLCASSLPHRVEVRMSHCFLCREAFLIRGQHGQSRNRDRMNTDLMVVS